MSRERFRRKAGLVARFFSCVQISHHDYNISGAVLHCIFWLALRASPQEFERGGVNQRAERQHKLRYRVALYIWDSRE